MGPALVIGRHNDGLDALDRLALTTLLRQEDHPGQGRQGDADGVGSAHPWDVLGLYRAGIAEVAAAVISRVGIEGLPVQACMGNPQAVVIAR